MEKEKQVSKSKTLLDLGDGDSWYADSRTLDNWDKIYFFLEEDKRQNEGKRNRNYSISQISKKIGVPDQQVRTAVLLMLKVQAFGRKKIIKTTGKNYSGKVTNLVELLNYRK